MFTDHTLLTTGGTGTFGNAVLRRFLATDIGEIRFFSRDEKKQHDMRLAYGNHRVYIGDVRRPDSLLDAMSRVDFVFHAAAAPKLKSTISDVRRPDSLLDAMSRVDFVLHAAALKQAPSCAFYPMEALLTNAVGAESVMNAAASWSVR